MLTITCRLWRCLIIFIGWAIVHLAPRRTIIFSVTLRRLAVFLTIRRLRIATVTWILGPWLWTNVGEFLSGNRIRWLLTIRLRCSRLRRLRRWLPIIGIRLWLVVIWRWIWGSIWIAVIQLIRWNAGWLTSIFWSQRITKIWWLSLITSIRTSKIEKSTWRCASS